MDLFCKNSEASRLQIHRLKNEYNDACFDIFEDEERLRLLPIEDVVENFRRALEEISSDEDIRQASKTEEALIESDA